MRVVVQRVLNASVTIDGEKTAQIEKGLLALVGINETDSDKTIDYILDKLINLRIFEDSEDKLNLSVKDINGEILIVPNFTIYGDARKGRRPSFINGASPNKAEVIFELVKKKSLEQFEKVCFGTFQADMKVNLTNDGPVTILLDSDKLF